MTSVPARSLEMDHRIGYIKPGYDADIVVWNAHPLSAGATPLQVYIDGKSTLEEKAVSASYAAPQKPQMRAEAAPENIQAFCSDPKQTNTVLVTGINTSYLPTGDVEQSRPKNLSMILVNGTIECVGDHGKCVSARSIDQVISLHDGYILPGLTTISSGLGLVEIEAEDSTTDGAGDGKADIYNPDSAVFAKYGIHFEGKAFDRARIGGVTRSITYPSTQGFLKGVSTGFKTAGGSNSLNGGIFKDDAALHVVIGQDAKG